ncbi:type VII secretion-associated protein [Nocardia sp. BMG111209]|uniref:type VII secretion-associated protein n=1 Tax=Nocardia sp. BMG111209 TaxID=1160137 RepID=UPI0003A9EB34|nr:type VII secretion-associated protein [Nocardia sp. BMG111209]
MPDIDVVLTDARLWARSYPAPATDPAVRYRRPSSPGHPPKSGRDTAFAPDFDSAQWDGPPSIMPSGDGFAVGAPLRPPSPAVSVVRMASADRIAFDPIGAQEISPMPTPAEALGEVFCALLANLRLPGPGRRSTVVVPTEWGTRRRGTVESAARHIAADVVLESLAQRAVALGASTGPGQRIAVLEANPLTTTATLVGRSGTRTWIEACEHEPAVGTDDLVPGRDGSAIAAVLGRLPDIERANHVLVTGLDTPGARTAVHTALAALPGCPADIRTVSGGDLLRPPEDAEQTAAERFSPLSARRSGSLHEYAVRRHRSRAGRILLPAVALVATLVVVVAVAHHRSASSTTAAQPTRTPAAAAPQPESARPSAAFTTLPAAPSISASGSQLPSGISPAPQTTVRLFDRVRADLPPGWHPNTRTDARVDLTPDNGARQRITVTQRQLSPGAKLGDVAETLDRQIAQRPPGTVGELKHDNVFGDHPGLSYEEFPGDGTTVRWQVLVDSGVQVSVGCQYESNTWPAVADACERFVRGLRVGE